MRTIAHLSDLHFGRVDAALLDPLRLQLEALDPDVVVISGDLTQRARAKEFREARDYLATLPRPQVVVPGNHDVPLYNLFQRFLTPLRKYKRIVSGDLEPQFIDDEIAVVGINTARSLVFKGGRINEEQVRKLRERLCGLPDRISKIVVTHHPFDVPEGHPDEDQIVGRAKMALKALAGCGADLFLSGHLHKAHVGHTASRYPIDGVAALVVQAGTTTSTRSRGETNSFNLLRVARRHIEIDRYVWKESAFRVESTEGYDHDGRGWHGSDGRTSAAA